MVFNIPVQKAALERLNAVFDELGEDLEARQEGRLTEREDRLVRWFRGLSPVERAVLSSALERRHQLPTLN